MLFDINKSSLNTYDFFYLIGTIVVVTDELSVCLCRSDFILQVVVNSVVISVVIEFCN